MIDQEADPSSVAEITAFASQQQPHVALLVAHIRQAMEDADKISRRMRLTGESFYVKSTKDEWVDEERASLRAWMASDEEFGLVWVCDAISEMTRSPSILGAVVTHIEMLLAQTGGQQIKTWRSVNGAGRMRVSAPPKPDSRAARRARAQARADAAVPCA